MGRHFITSNQIDELAEQGETRLEVDDGTTVTDMARERALQRGISVVTVGSSAEPGPTGPVVEASGGTQAVEADADRVRAAVRTAILAAVGEAPPGLDVAIDRVLRDQEGGRS